MAKKFHEKSEHMRYHNRRVAVTKEFNFDAAHELIAYEGKCKYLHGHTYKLIITFSGYLDDKGFVLDFSNIKRLYQEAVAKKLDHCYLNEVLQMNTTVENIIVWIWEALEQKFSDWGWLKRGIRLEELTLYETPESSATLKREWMKGE